MSYLVGYSKEKAKYKYFYPDIIVYEVYISEIFEKALAYKYEVEMSKSVNKCRSEIIKPDGTFNFFALNLPYPWRDLKIVRSFYYFI
jgi:hypothetical protein